MGQFLRHVCPPKQRLHLLQEIPWLPHAACPRRPPACLLTSRLPLPTHGCVQDPTWQLEVACVQSLSKLGSAVPSVLYRTVVQQERAELPDFFCGQGESEVRVAWAGVYDVLTCRHEEHEGASCRLPSAWNNSIPRRGHCLSASAHAAVASSHLAPAYVLRCCRRRRRWCRRPPSSAFSASEATCLISSRRAPPSGSACTQVSKHTGYSAITVGIFLCRCRADLI